MKKTVAVVATASIVVILLLAYFPPPVLGQGAPKPGIPISLYLPFAITGFTSIGSYMQSPPGCDTSSTPCVLEATTYETSEPVNGLFGSSATPISGTGTLNITAGTFAASPGAPCTPSSPPQCGGPGLIAGFVTLGLDLNVGTINAQGQLTAFAFSTVGQAMVTAHLTGRGSVQVGSHQSLVSAELECVGTGLGSGSAFLVCQGILTTP